MSEHEQEQASGDEQEPGGIGEEQLPEDLRADEDNPLARHPDETGDQDDAIGADSEGEPETAPLTAEDAEYGSGSSGT